ncbi:MAG: hypothetical protein E5W49_02335 [Mesorhizobium sp.]|nr:MAG: hypothetical protein E5W49_02335 [Mesorhizobium sp.]
MNDAGAQADIFAKLGLIQTLFRGGRVDVEELAQRLMSPNGRTPLGSRDADKKVVSHRVV